VLLEIRSVPDVRRVERIMSRVAISRYLCTADVVSQVVAQWRANPSETAFFDDLLNMRSEIYGDVLAATQPNGDLMAVTGNSLTTNVWDRRTGALVATLGDCACDVPAGSPSFSADGRWLAMERDGGS